MNIGFVTIERSGNYIARSVADLFASASAPLTVDLFDGGPDARYLEPFESDPRITIHALTKSEWEAIAGWTGSRRCSYNHWRAMDYYARRGCPACICENDVIFCNKFNDRLKEAIAEIETSQQRYVLSFYAPHDLRRKQNAVHGKYHSIYPAQSFYGSQGMYYPSSVIAELTAFFRKFAVDQPRAPADVILKDFCLEGTVLYGTPQSLVQHVGYRTTVEWNYHCSPAFDKNYNPDGDILTGADSTKGAGRMPNFDEINGKLEVILQDKSAVPQDLSGRGVVIAGGGVKYFTCAWVNINMLRRAGCTLPIELWHLGEREMTTAMRRMMEPLGVKTVDALELRKKIPARILNGWELKPYAILHSAFQEVLFLDADNVPIVDPTFLFSTEHYLKTGAVFWPDRGRLRSRHAIWEMCGVAYRDEPEFESGQIVVDKARCWNALRITMLMNEYSDYFYKYIHGDKETFHMAWRILNQEYSMPEHRVQCLHGTLCQHDFTGRRIFQHRSTAKWHLGQANQKIPDFVEEETCFEFLKELEDKWTRLENKTTQEIVGRPTLCAN